MVRWSTSFWYLEESDYSLIGFLDSDFVGCNTDRKSTSGICHQFEKFLVLWHSKYYLKVNLSRTEAKYVAVGSYCAQSLWFKQHFLDYDLKLYHIPIKYDNTSVINLTKNWVLHSRTKHIEILRHFLLDRVKKGMLFLNPFSRYIMKKALHFCFWFWLDAKFRLESI